jgi:hypothetical protein
MSFTGTTPSDPDFDFSGPMNPNTDITEPTFSDMLNPNYNSPFDFTFPATTFPAPGPPIIVPSSTVTPGIVMAAPQGLPTIIETNDQPTAKKTRKRKKPEDENANCILPEGSRRQRKPRRLSD